MKDEVRAAADVGGAVAACLSLPRVGARLDARGEGWTSLSLEAEVALIEWREGGSLGRDGLDDDGDVIWTCSAIRSGDVADGGQDCVK